MTKHDNSALQLERIVFFSDAVFAIAITLLIIEIKVPHLEHEATNREFWLALLKLVPNFVGYFFSFFVVGAYWMGHHEIYGDIVRWNKGLMWRNIAFLAAIAFFPFSTAFYSEYPTNFVPLSLYAGSFALAGFLGTWQWRYAVKQKLVDESLTEKTISRQTWHYTVLPIVGVTAILIGLIKPLLAGFAFWLIPISQIIIRKKFAENKKTSKLINDEFTGKN